VEMLKISGRSAFKKMDSGASLLDGADVVVVEDVVPITDFDSRLNDRLGLVIANGNSSKSKKDKKQTNK